MQEIINIYYNGWLNCIKMLKNRKYKIDYDKYNVNFDEFKLLYDKDILLIKALDNNKQVYVKFAQSNKNFSTMDPKIEILNDILKQSRKNKLSDLLKIMNNKKIRIIVIYNSYNAKNNKFDNKFEAFGDDHEHLEVFQVHKMAINIINHIYQSKYILLNNKQVELLKNLFNVSPKLLGSICINDPINKYYNGKPKKYNKRADIYKVIRKDGNIYYRRVISKKMNIEN